jgi:hypothetical protein
MSSTSFLRRHFSFPNMARRYHHGADPEMIGVQPSHASFKPQTPRATENCLNCGRWERTRGGTLPPRTSSNPRSSLSFGWHRSPTAMQAATLGLVSASNQTSTHIHTVSITPNYELHNFSPRRLSCPIWTGPPPPFAIAQIISIQSQKRWTRPGG